MAGRMKDLLAALEARRKPKPAGQAVERIEYEEIDRPYWKSQEDVDRENYDAAEASIRDAGPKTKGVGQLRERDEFKTNVLGLADDSVNVGVGEPAVMRRGPRELSQEEYDAPVPAGTNVIEPQRRQLDPEQAKSAVNAMGFGGPSAVADNMGLRNEQRGPRVADYMDSKGGANWQHAVEGGETFSSAADWMDGKGGANTREPVKPAPRRPQVSVGFGAETPAMMSNLSGNLSSEERSARAGINGEAPRSAVASQSPVGPPPQDDDELLDAQNRGARGRLIARLGRIADKFATRTQSGKLKPNSGLFDDMEKSAEHPVSDLLQRRAQAKAARAEAHGLERERIGDERYADETGYKRGRDAVGDTRYTDETGYERNRDTVKDSQWGAEHGERGRHNRATEHNSAKHNANVERLTRGEQIDARKAGDEMEQVDLLDKNLGIMRSIIGEEDAATRKKLGMTGPESETDRHILSAQGDIPGAGWYESGGLTKPFGAIPFVGKAIQAADPSNLTNSPKAIRFRQAAHDNASIITKKRSGAAASDEEREMIMRTYGIGRGDPETATREGVQKFEEDIALMRQGLRAKYAPEVWDAVDQRIRARTAAPSTLGPGQGQRNGR